MTETIPATPGWVDERLQEIFARLPEGAQAAGVAFAECLARQKSPGAPSDLLGAEFEPCHAAVRQALLHAQVEAGVVRRVMGELEALEAEIAGDS